MLSNISIISFVLSDVVVVVYIILVVVFVWFEANVIDVKKEFNWSQPAIVITKNKEKK